MNKISDDEEAIHGNNKAYIAVRFAVWKFFEKNMDKSLRCLICNDVAISKRNCFNERALTVKTFK